MIIACFPLSELLIAVKFIDLIIKDVSGIYNDIYEQKRIGRTNRTKGDRRLYFSRAYDRIKNRYVAEENSETEIQKRSDAG